MKMRNGALIAGLVFFVTLPAQTANVNRADIRIQTLRRSAVVLNLSIAGSTIEIAPEEKRLATISPDGHLTIKVPVKVPVGSHARRPTPVVFINKTESVLLVQQQPQAKKRRAACIDKLNVAGLVALCDAETAKGNHPTRACDEKALVESCVEDPTFDVAASDTLVPPKGSFEMHMTREKEHKEDESVDYVIRLKPDENPDNPQSGTRRDLQPAAVKLEPEDGDVPTDSAELKAAIVPLDSAGVASWRYMNPMNPACIRCKSSNPSEVDAAAVDIAFENRTVDRTFIVSLQVPTEVGKGVVARRLAKCEQNKPCTVSIRVPPHDRGVFDAALINALPAERLLRFDLTFLDETERVPNPNAYLSQLPAFGPPDTLTVAELESQTSFDVTGKLTTAAEPEVGQVVKQQDPTFASLPCRQAGDPLAPSVCVAQPFGGASRHHDTAQARLDLTQNLGSRANAAVTVALRNADLGGKDDSKLALTQYLVNIYSRLDLGLQFGRTTFLDSANSIALSEKGDGYRWIARIPRSPMTASFTHILKRESGNGIADHVNRDNYDWLFQLRGFHFPSKPIRDVQGAGAPRFLGLRSADFLMLLGKEKGNTPGVDASVTALSPYHYRTIGGEVFYAFPKMGCVGGSDCDHNHGSIDAPSTGCASTICNGSGTVALITATWTPEYHSEDEITSSANQSVTFLAGAGSGDRAGTPSRDEGYIGETAAFAPDALFLSMFEPAVDTVQHHPIGASLSNKTYLGLQYTNNTYSPLVWVAERLGVTRTDIASKATIIRFHDYRFREPVNASRSAAREVDVDFQIESPKGVNVNVSAARMWPGAGVRPIIQRAAWILSSGVSLRL
jgi:hypothetical protein